jgi:hypothetical protein
VDHKQDFHEGRKSNERLLFTLPRARGGEVMFQKEAKTIDQVFLIALGIHEPLLGDPLFGSAHRQFTNDWYIYNRCAFYLFYVKAMDDIDSRLCVLT